ncbi:hypothetical protein V6N12_031860 [Hibiscus sabdariffa]|uniref:Uncharacterized protein n=1 Tax=Hibiscus sabdariffa TaxID=183260 RepID=A0ABR2BYC9_9ROSI
MSGNPSEAVPALFGGFGGRPPDSRAPSVGSLPTGREGIPVVGRSMGESLSQDQSDGQENSDDIDCNFAGAKENETYASMVSKGTGSAGVSSSVGIGKDDVVVLADDFVIDRSGPYPSVKFSDRVHDQIDRITVPPTEPQVSNTMEDTSPNVDKGSELFGPWMVAESRRRRNVSLNRNGHKTDNSVSVAGGSRFATLYDMGGEDMVPTVVGMIENTTMDRVQSVDADSVMVTKEKVQPKEVRKSATYMKSNPDKKKKVVSQPIEASRVASLVDEKEPEVVATESAQGAGLHMTVSIMERYDGSKPPARGKMVKARGHGNKGTNEGYVATAADGGTIKWSAHADCRHYRGSSIGR